MLLEVRDINTYYGLSHVLQGMSLDIKDGEMVALLGKNGMGKSTTLKSIIGLLKAKSGEMIFQGENISNMPAHKIASAGIGYVPEERRIFPELSVLDNLLLGAKSGKDKTSTVKKEWTIDRIFQRFTKLKERMNMKGRYLSGGEQQMLSIGRALMGNPALLLVDEPTEGLAPLMVEEVRNVLEDINREGVSILIVEHNLEVALSLAQRVFLMGKGQIGFTGTVNELRENDAVRKKYLEI